MKTIALSCLLTLIASIGSALTVHNAVPVAPTMAVSAIVPGAQVRLAPPMVGASLMAVPAATPFMTPAMPVQSVALEASGNSKASLVSAQHAMTSEGSDKAAVSAQVFDQQGRHAALSVETDVVQPSAEKSPRALVGGLQNRLIDPVTGLSAYGKIKEWSMGHILSVLTGRMLTRTSKLGDILEIVGFVTGHDAVVLSIDKDGTKTYSRIDYQRLFENSTKAEALIRKQYPELANINPPEFKSAEAVDAWVAEQEAKFGKDLPLVQTAQK